MNSPEDWEQLKALFARCVELPAGERDAWLRRECAGRPELGARLRRLLARRERSASIFAGDAVALLSRLAPEDGAADARIGAEVGPYRLLRLLGEGGMGRVWLASRADGQFQHQVALKLIRSGFATPDLHQRFLRERDTLAQLTHPNIAQLHDGGVSADGAPYFTLELVDGEPLTDWCDRRRLDLRQRVRLLLKVCDAVEHAHRNLIVHRDLKPSNILVTAAGEPKLLDFGIAKPLPGRDIGADLTATQGQPMTPEYAAPEQVLGEAVTTATDVYSLGVLLYRLLCGRLPYRRASLGRISWTKAILEESPEPLVHAVERTPGGRRGASPDATAGQADAGIDAPTIAAARRVSPAALRRALRGDPERIVRRALAKAPEARYPSVGAMAADLRAFVDGRAISGGTRTYRMRKFVRRHWLPLGAAAALLIVFLAGAGIVVAEAHKIEREARTTAAVKDFLFGLFAAVDPREAKGRDISARQLLERGRKNIESKPPDDPVVKAELQAVLGRIDFRLGLYTEASELQQQAAVGFGMAGGHALQQLQAELDRIATLNEVEDVRGAGAVIDAAAAHLAALPGAPDGDRVRLLMARAQLAFDERRKDDARRYAEAALALARRAHVKDDLLGHVLMIAGNAQWARHSVDAAAADYRAALAATLRAEGPEGLRVAALHTDLSIVAAVRSRYAEALAEVRQALAINTKVLGADHPGTLFDAAYVGLYNYHLGHFRLARQELEEAADKQRRQLGANSPVLAGTLINLALALTQVPDLGGAEQALVQSVHIFESRYSREYPGAQTALGDLGYVHLLQGRLDRAGQELAEVEANDARHGIDDDVTTCYWAGELARRRGDLPTALRQDRLALRAALKKAGENSRYAAMAHHYLGLALRDSGDGAGAEHELRAALASFAGYLPGADHPLAATTRLALGRLLARDAGRRAEASRLIAEAAAIREKFLGADDPRTREARAALRLLSRRS